MPDTTVTFASDKWGESLGGTVTLPASGTISISLSGLGAAGSAQLNHQGAPPVGLELGTSEHAVSAGDTISITPQNVDESVELGLSWPGSTTAQTTNIEFFASSLMKLGTITLPASGTISISVAGDGAMVELDHKAGSLVDLQPGQAEYTVDAGDMVMAMASAGGSVTVGWSYV